MASVVLAETNEEAANSKALSTRESIAVSALSQANQSQPGSVAAALSLTALPIKRRGNPCRFFVWRFGGCGGRAHFIRICTDIEINGKVKPARLSTIARVIVKRP